MSDWTRDELKAAVEAYADMLKRQLRGEKFVKKAIYEALHDRYGRSVKSYEYRMQNISYVYSLLGRQWVTGLRPAENVGSNVIAIIKQLITEVEGYQSSGVTTLHGTVAETKAKYARANISKKPVGNTRPETRETTTTTYVRDSAVVEWVLARAKGRCECCKASAPFMKDDGEPFLEVHHIHRLADGGRDTVDNATALCPNCHRELHYGVNRQPLAETLRRYIHSVESSTI